MVAVVRPARRACLGAAEAGAVQFAVGKCLVSVPARALADAFQAVAGGSVAVSAGQQATAARLARLLVDQRVVVPAAEQATSAPVE